MNVHLFIIDPQVDFCDPQGALFVGGADQDCVRLGTMIDRLSSKISDIHVTLDSHRTVDIAHPIFWVNSTGQHPQPFTIISENDVVNGVWMATNPQWRKKAVEYVKSLSTNGRYPLCIWPPHCIIGTKGHSIDPSVSDALIRWEQNRFAVVDFVTKGSNVFTEHYSAVKADVPDAGDPTTMLNRELIDVLANADVIAIAGEALSHCVANTITDVADNFGEDNIKKFVLLEDCSSNVTGFENLGTEFVSRMKTRGMKVERSDRFLA